MVRPVFRSAPMRWLAEVGCLRGADGGVAVVVEDEELDGELEAVDGLELLDVEHEAAVAIDGDDFAAGVGDGDGDGHGDGVAHGAEAGGVVEALRVQGGAGEEVDLDAGAGVADDEAVFGC